MNRIALLAGAMLLLIPSMANANCGDGGCSVGAFGQGGVSSGGNAQGFHYIIQSPFLPNTTSTNSGNPLAGRLKVEGQFNGMLSGGSPDGVTANGHGTGFFGDWSGQCPVEGFPNFPDCE